MSDIYESHVEEMVVELLKSLGYNYISPEEQENERENLSDVVLVNRLKNAIWKLNPDVADSVKEDAVKQVLNLFHSNINENNEAFHKILTEGVGGEHYVDGDVRGDTVKLVDFENPLNNDLVVTNQFTVINNNVNKRPDVVILINGLPLVVIELKNPADENATTKKGYTQLQNYKTAIPHLFYYNSLLVASDGLEAKFGSITAGWDWFMQWKTIDGVKEHDPLIPQIETLLKGMLKPSVLLDLIKHFIVFERSKKEDPETKLQRLDITKKIAGYHQYHAVNKAVEKTIDASSENGDRKAGVVWHTQGSGKSLSMVFYTGKIVLEMNNPTVVVITDRNDLDDQLYEIFANSKQLLRQEPVQAKSRDELKNLLKTNGGGIIFTTIQKFFPENEQAEFDLLSDRKNIVVIADEAHRSQYGFSAKTRIKDDEAIVRYGFAKYLRDAIPNASFIGFTGTPIEKEDASTPQVFGNYIDVYDMQQAQEDGATVKIFYESRLAKVHLKPEEKDNMDKEIEEIVENEDATISEKAKAKWTQLEAIVGQKERLATVAKDIVEHFENREEVLDGKAMIVTMSRRIAVELYNEIIKLRPKWHETDKNKGVLKVVMTSSSSDDPSWQVHSTNKTERKALAERFKDPKNSLKLVIVRDMWLTGFDVPCMHTMYIDKMMRGHTLMQAIARVNRVYKDKQGGLIVDYIGIATDLKKALAIYTESGGKGEPTLDIEKAVATMLEKYEVVVQMFNKFDYKKYFKLDTRDKLILILEAEEYVLGLEDGKNRFINNVQLLVKAYSLVSNHPKAMEIKDDVGFFSAVKARLVKFQKEGTGKTEDEIETAIRQIVDRAVVSDGIIDIFDAAGIKKPDISILSEEFMEEIKGMNRKNIAIELLKKLLNDEIGIRSKRNFIQSKKMSEMLENTIRKYQNNLITAVEVIEELIKLSNEIKEADKRGEKMNLSEYELAFYDALSDNDSAKEVLGNDILRDLSRVLVERVKTNTAIDWTIKESVQAKLRVIVKRTLREFGYPPDMEKLATENVLKQAKLLAEEWN